MLRGLARRVSSSWRVARLRWSGNAIGKGVVIGRSRIIGKRISIGSGTRIGDGVSISGDEVHIAENTSVESGVRIRARRISIGAETLIEEGVTIGGLQTAKSSLSIGSNCVVLFRSYLNTTYPLVIEDDVGIGGYCLIFTHGLWQSAFEGYPVVFGPVTIRKGVWLPWHVFVMPGVEIGEGATIGAGSVVTRPIPAHSLAIGVPARVVKEPPEYPKRLDAQELRALVRFTLDAFAEDLQSRGIAASVSGGSDGMVLSSTLGSIVFGPIPPDAQAPVELLLDGSRPSGFWVNLIARTWNLDLARPLHAQLKTFLRRMGVRLSSSGR